MMFGDGRYRRVWRASPRVFSTKTVVPAGNFMESAGGSPSEHHAHPTSSTHQWTKLHLFDNQVLGEQSYSGQDQLRNIGWIMTHFGECGLHDLVTFLYTLHVLHEFYWQVIKKNSLLVVVRYAIASHNRVTFYTVRQRFKDINIPRIHVSSLCLWNPSYEPSWIKMN